MKKFILISAGIFIFAFAGELYSQSFICKLKLEGQRLQYQEKKFIVEVDNTHNTVSIEFDINMTEQTTEHTNYVTLNGSAKGTVEGDKMTARGNANIATFEKGHASESWSSAIEFKGTINSANDMERTISGDFSMTKEGEVIKGSFTGKGRSEHLIKLIRGDAEILRLNGEKWEKFTEQTSITINDRIKTGPNTRMEIMYPDGTVFRVKSNSILSLLKGGLQLQVGEAWFNMQKQGNTMQVVTPTTVFGVLGNIPLKNFFFSDCLAADNVSGIVNVKEEGSTKISVLSGNMFVTNKLTNNTTELTANLSLTIKPDGKEVKNSVDGDKVLAKFDSDTESNYKESENDETGIKATESDNLSLIIIIGGAFVFLILGGVLVILLISANKKKKISIQSSNVFPVKNYCKQCGAEINFTAKFCPRCGNKTDL